MSLSMSADIRPPRSIWHPLPWWKLARGLWGTLRSASRSHGDPRQAMSHWAASFLNHLDVEVQTSSPIPAGGQLWVCNHLSWLDPLICLSLRPSAALAKAEVGGYPLVGRPAARMGLRFVDRENPVSRAAAMARLCSDLRQGTDFLLFPEGTTTLGDELAPLYEGSLRAAYRLGITVLPLRLQTCNAHYPWTGDESLPPHLLGLARARGTQVQLHPGPVLHPRDVASESAWIHSIQSHLSPRSLNLKGCA
jgi:1-acyl-sn-glycerol-3-phosphate acyltransferase